MILMTHVTDWFSLLGATRLRGKHSFHRWSEPIIMGHIDDRVSFSVDSDDILSLVEGFSRISITSLREN